MLATCAMHYCVLYFHCVLAGWLLPYVRAWAPDRFLFFSFSCNKGAVIEVAPAPANTVSKVKDAPAW